MLKNKLINQIKEYIPKKDLTSKLDIKQTFEVEFLEQGEYNINFIIFDSEKKYVFRVNTASQLCLKEQITYEFNALKALEISKVTPKVFYVDDSKYFFKFGILIMEFLEGKPLDYKSDLEKSAQIFGSIHSMDIANLQHKFIKEENLCSRRVEEGTRLLKDYLLSPLVPKSMKEFFYNFLEWAELNKKRDTYFEKNKWHVINNTEVNSHNFIIGKENSYLIDWEKPVISDPCQDITQFLAPTTTLWKADYILDKDEISCFYNKYIKTLNTKIKGTQHDTIIERVELYKPYLYLRALSWCAYAWIEYQNPDKDIKNMDTFAKIESYLELNFMRGLLSELGIRV